MSVGDTPKFGGKSLCETCRFATIVEGTTFDQRIVKCTWLGLVASKKLSSFSVKRCTDYAIRTAMSIRELTKIAWILRSDRHTIGFVHPKDMDEDEKKEMRDM